MAQAWSTGPVDLWVGVGSQGTPKFLGHSENGYEINPRPQYEQVMNDLAGIRVPYERGWQGADYMVLPGGSLTRWNENIYGALQGYVDPKSTFAGALIRGRENTVARGSLMMTQGLSIGVWLRYPFSVLPAFAGLPGGYRFVNCVVDADSMNPGAKAYKIGPAFYAWPAFIPNVGFYAYDGDMSALGTID